MRADPAPQAGFAATRGENCEDRNATPIKSIVQKGPDVEWDSSHEPYQCVPRVRGARCRETIGRTHDQEGQHEHHRPQRH
jgi:hypothetical protein